MEYILEELLRQRNALAVLMTGEMPEEQESSGAGTKTHSELLPSGKSEWQGAAVDGYWGTVFREDERAPLDEAEWNALREDGTAILSQENRLHETGSMMPEQGRAVSETTREWTRVASAAGELPWAAKVSTGAGITETASERMNVHWNSGTAEMDARALSRAIQRDARRYDGGFNAR